MAVNAWVLKRTLKKQTGNNASPIRRIGKEEADQRRQWPDKKLLASEQNIPLPKPGEKNRIHSVLVALPVLMLMIGLFVYFKGENAQNNGTHILSELVTRHGQFKSVSTVSGIGDAKHYLWYFVDGRAKGARISVEQKERLSSLAVGDDLILDLAPKVVNSKTLWAYKVQRSGVELIGPIKK